MFRLHSSNRTERLAARLIRRVAEDPPGVFEPVEIVVPSAAMRRYLTLTLADSQGICSNVRFDFLATWLWQLIRRGIPTVAETSPFAAPVLGWRVLRAFDDPAFVAAEPRLSRYLGAADPVMRYELAVRTAALFEQYTTYRPDWLALWRRGQYLPAQALPEAARDDERWQAALWRWLAEDLGVAATHPADAFIAALQQPRAPDRDAMVLPRAVHLFVLPAIPPLHLDLLVQLGRAMEVDCYVLDPSEAYWHEVVAPARLARLAERGEADWHETGNRLLASWGRQTQALVAGIARAADAATGLDIAVDDSDFVANPAPTLLASVQNAMLALEELAPRSLQPADDDRSLELHVCHSMTRELEVVQDRLLALFAGADGSAQPLLPADVLVVVPDIDVAAPLIDAVFGTVPGERRIPYVITGRQATQENGPARALVETLALAMSRVTASDLFALLQLPPVAARFGLDDDALARLRDWLDGAGFRWGLDAAHRASFGLPAESRQTLADALDRLFLGYALPSASTTPFADCLPVGDAEGNDALALGALARFAERLQWLNQALSQPLPAAQWPAICHRVLDDFLAAGTDGQAAIRQVRQAIGTVAESLQHAGYAAALPFAVFRAALLEALDPPAPGGIPSGAVTFASLRALRAVPFQVICCLGLDDGVFPAPSRPAEFDLMALAPRFGDRRRRDDDRNALLDLLLSACRLLHLSHCGRSVRDNAPLPPSVLVAELIDAMVGAIDAPPATARARLVVEHPLQSFSATLFQPDGGGDPRRRSHDRETAAALSASLSGTPAASRATSAATSPAASPADAPAAGNDDDATEAEEGDDPRMLPCFVSRPLPLDPDAPRDVSIEQLAEFFKKPAAFFIRRRLGIDLGREIAELADDEGFLPDWAGRTALAARLLPAYLEGARGDALRQRALAGLEWPAGAIGQATLDRELAMLSRFAAEIARHSAQPARPPLDASVIVDVDGEPWRVHGRFDDLHGDGLLRWHYDEERAVDLLGAWIAHLLMVANSRQQDPAAPPPSTRLVLREAGIELRPPEDASGLLADLVAVYREGLSRPSAFHAKSGWALVGGDTLTAVRGRWLPLPHRPYAEGNDASVRLTARGRVHDLDPGFEALARRVLEPLAEHRTMSPLLPEPDNRSVR